MTLPRNVYGLPRHSTINKESSLEYRNIGRFTQTLGVSTDLWILPRMDRDTESSASWQTRYERSYRRKQEWIVLQAVTFYASGQLDRCDNEGQTRSYQCPG